MLRETHVNRESKILELTICYTYFMNMKLLSVLTSLSANQDKTKVWCERVKIESAFDTSRNVLKFVVIIQIKKCICKFWFDQLFLHPWLRCSFGKVEMLFSPVVGWCSIWPLIQIGGSRWHKQKSHRLQLSPPYKALPPLELPRSTTYQNQKSNPSCINLYHSSSYHS